MKKIIVVVCLITGMVSQLHAQVLKLATSNGKYGFTDNEGKEIIPFKYESGWSFIDNLAKVKLNGKWGFIDKTGKEIIPFKYDFVRDFSGGFAFAKINSKWALIDNTAKEITTFKYDDAYPFVEKLAAVMLNGKWGFIDQAGKQIIGFKYDEYSFFDGGIAFVSAGKKYGCIDKTGKEIVPLIHGFDDGYSAYKKQVELNGANRAIDKFGAAPTTLSLLIVKDKPESEKYLRSDVIIYKENGKQGLKKTDGTILTHPHFDQITFERSPVSFEFLYHLTGKLYDKYYHGQKVDIWYQPYQEKINPNHLVAYTVRGETCFTCKGTGKITIDETEKVWVEPSTIVTGSSSDPQKHVDITSDKKGATVITTNTYTTTKTTPGYYKDVKKGTKKVSCNKCKNGTKVREHYYDYNSYEKTYKESVY